MNLKLIREQVALRLDQLPDTQASPFVPDLIVMRTCVVRPAGEMYVEYHDTFTTAERDDESATINLIIWCLVPIGETEQWQDQLDELGSNGPDETSSVKAVLEGERLHGTEGPQATVSAMYGWGTTRVNDVPCGQCLFRTALHL